MVSNRSDLLLLIIPWSNISLITILYNTNFILNDDHDYNMPSNWLIDLRATTIWVTLLISITIIKCTNKGNVADVYLFVTLIALRLFATRFISRKKMIDWKLKLLFKKSTIYQK